MRQFPISFFAGRDPLVAAYATASGATDLGGIAGLIAYLRAEGLIDNFRLYPMKSSQNAGTGTTVYGIGGLTSNNGTLVNGPSWAAGGMTMDTSSQCMTIADFLGTDTLTVFCRRSGTPANGGASVGQWDSGVNKRSFSLREYDSASDVIQLNRSSNGSVTTAAFEAYYSGASEWPSADACFVAQWISGGARNCWVNKTSKSLSLVGGFSAQTAKYNSDVDVTLNCDLNSGTPANLAGGVYIATGFLEGVTPTQTQRETITDFINAL
jgi:hypothetical protein